jgi:hypothetical protein
MVLVVMVVMVVRDPENLKNFKGKQCVTLEMKGYLSLY